MSSILTNTSAMVALQTMKAINTNLNKAQNEIATGKAVGTAKENAATWAIAKVMESDVKGFKSISDSLSLGSSTIAVARSAAEQVTDLLGEIKTKIVASQEENVDRTKIQADIVSLRDQVASIVGAAQFNGLNLLSNRQGGATVAQIVGNTGAGAGIFGSSKVSVLSSLDRASTGAVTTSTILASKGDLGQQARTAGAGTDLAAAAITGAGAIAAGASGALTVVGDIATVARGGNRVLAGDTYTVAGLTGITATLSYVARDGENVTDVAKGLVSRINFEAKKAGLSYTAEFSGTAGVTITNGTATAITTTTATTSGGTAGGGLALLGEIDVSTEAGAAAGLAAIEGLTQTAIKAASDFGTVQKRIDIQNDFVGNLMDSLKAGIGSLVDANMEEAAARLQALQVQQQLGTQALSIANQAPQNILALFR
ncbi:flagellin [Fertoebacter nigrum]|uniref:Flagellin n=1 Tax=Fertoeibacter niger TaxID=2656921 RepID=A0A8X8KL41_9RHOB|nr:flagellin [Fertoeibacter niger]NUB44914.1 flagellin [Fertoeibacter niger]